MRIQYSISEKDLFVRLNNLRGILAVVVLLSHIWGYTGIRILVPFNKVVTIAVACFFFLSGYGMTRSYEKKKNYLKEIFYIKIPYLVWMAVLAYIFSAILEWMLIRFGCKGGFLPFGLRSFVVSTNWYVYELIGFYLLFAFAVKYVNKKYQIIFVGLISLIAFIVLFHSGLVEAYYNSIIGFVLGFICARADYIRILERFKRGYLAAFLVLAGAFGGMLFLDRTTIWFAVIRNVAAVGAIVLALYLIRYVDTCSRINVLLSRISPEIYFYHMPLALLLSEVIDNVMIYTVMVIGISLLISPIISIGNKWILKKIKSFVNV